MRWPSVFTAWRRRSDELGWQDDDGRHRGGGQFERDLLIERTLAGQARARAEGKRFGRKPVLDGEQRQKALQRLADGASVSGGGAGDEGQQGYHHAGPPGGSDNYVGLLMTRAIRSKTLSPSWTGG
jgi:hypothetical protein